MALTKYLHTKLPDCIAFLERLPRLLQTIVKQGSLFKNWMQFRKRLCKWNVATQYKRRGVFSALCYFLLFYFGVVISVRLFVLSLPFKRSFVVVVALVGGFRTLTARCEPQHSQTVWLMRKWNLLNMFLFWRNGLEMVLLPYYNG